LASDSLTWATSIAIWIESSEEWVEPVAVPAEVRNDRRPRQRSIEYFIPREHNRFLCYKVMGGSSVLG
jgi:hypothetical protein